MVKILITGANGQLGRCLCNLAGHAAAGYDMDRLDIRNTKAVYEAAKREGAKALINCAAYTAVDKAEQEREPAWAVNAEAVKGLAEVCNQLGIFLVHISTDYVFDGTAATPYSEKDTPNPLSVYGASKLAGELFACAYGRSVVVRTSWVYSLEGQNFISSILRLGAEQKELKVVNDQISAPTYVRHLAKALWRITEQITAAKAPESLMGVYHFCNRGACSRFEFAQKMKELAQFKAAILPIPSLEYPTPAKRPAYSVLNTQKVIDTFGIVPPLWEEGLEACFRDHPTQG